MIRKSFLFLLAALLVLAVFVSCDADQMAKFGKTLSGTGTNIYNTDGNVVAVSKTKTSIDKYVAVINNEITGLTKKEAMDEVVSFVNEASFSDNDRDALRETLAAESACTIKVISNLYDTTKNNVIESIPDEDVKEVVEEFMEEFEQIVKDYIDYDTTNNNPASYLAVVVAGAVCNFIESANVVAQYVVSQETIDVGQVWALASPVLTSLEAVDKLADLGVFQTIKDIMSFIEDLGL